MNVEDDENSAITTSHKPISFQIELRESTLICHTLPSRGPCVFYSTTVEYDTYGKISRE